MCAHRFCRSLGKTGWPFEQFGDQFWVGYRTRRHQYCSVCGWRTNWAIRSPRRIPTGIPLNMVQAGPMNPPIMRWVSGETVSIQNLMMVAAFQITVRMCVFIIDHCLETLANYRLLLNKLGLFEYQRSPLCVPYFQPIDFSVISTAHAQETIDVGALQNKDYKVVQKPDDKENLKELAIHAGLMPFDPFSITPKVDVTYAQYFSDTKAWEVSLGAGYGLKNGNYRRLQNTVYNVEPDVYRNLGSVIGDVQWAPVYAKMATNGRTSSTMMSMPSVVVSASNSLFCPIKFGFLPTVSLGVGSLFS